MTSKYLSGKSFNPKVKIDWNKYDHSQILNLTLDDQTKTKD